MEAKEGKGVVGEEPFANIISSVFGLRFMYGISTFFLRYIGLSIGLNEQVRNITKRGFSSGSDVLRSSHLLFAVLWFDKSCKKTPFSVSLVFF